MPKAIKKRVEKKTILEEAEVKGIAVKLLDVVKKNKNIFIVVAVILSFAVISVAGIKYYSSSTNRKAFSFEKEAYNYYYPKIEVKKDSPDKVGTDKERWKKALELFQKADETKPTPTTQFYIGNCYFNLEDYDNAVKAYKVFIDKYKSDKEILPLVYQKLSSAYFKKGENDEAIKVLKTLSEFKNGVFKDAVLILEARHYMNIGEKEEAIKKYKELADKFPSSPWVDEANARIKMQEESKVQQSPISEDTKRPEEEIPTQNLPSNKE